MTITDAGTTSPSTPALRPLVILLGGLLLLRTVALFAGDGIAYALLGALGRPDAWAQALLFSNVTVVAVDVLTVAVLVAVCRREGRRLRDLIGLVRLRRDVPVALLVALIALVALVAATFLANLVVYGGAPPSDGVGTVPLWLGVWSIVVLPVTVAAAEELLYRGYLLSRLTARLGWWPAALLVSLGFGLQHAAFSASSFSAVLARVIATFLLGLVFATLARKLGRLAPLIIGHWLVDVVGLGLPMLAAAVLGTR
ncbi:MAG: CPBP family intramembrane glutamic endopeptidase [Propionibacteriaceae bacterium]